jgi:hypothetical protein
MLYTFEERKQGEREYTEQRVRKIGRKIGKVGMRLYSEKRTIPRKERSHHSAPARHLGWQAQEGSETGRHPEQHDRYSANRQGTGIACQPFFPREPIMGTLCTRKKRRRGFVGLVGWRELHIDSLVAEQVHAGSAMVSTTPLLPEQRR